MHVCAGGAAREGREEEEGSCFGDEIGFYEMED